MKIALLTNMLPPYRLSFFNELAKEVDLTVVADVITEKGRQWKFVEGDIGFDYEILNGVSLNLNRKRKDVGYEERRPFHFSLKLFKVLKRLKPDVVVSGEFGFRTLWAILYAKCYGQKVIVWSEGTMHTEGVTTFSRKLIRRVIVRLVDGFWTNGADSTALVEHYGFNKRAAIQEAMTGVDTTWWQTEYSRLLPERESIKADLQLSEQVVIFSGSLSSRKGVSEMMNALTAWRPTVETSVILLGDGDLAMDVEKWAKELTHLKVVRPGFIEPSELPRFMVAADWAILPTLDDNWPLATLESLVMRLPQIFSKYNGASTDLCIAGLTGYIIDPLDSESFIAGLKKMEEFLNKKIPEQNALNFASKYMPYEQAKRALESIKSIS